MYHHKICRKAKKKKTTIPITNAKRNRTQNSLIQNSKLKSGFQHTTIRKKNIPDYNGSSR